MVVAYFLANWVDFWSPFYGIIGLAISYLLATIGESISLIPKLNNFKRLN